MVTDGVATWQFAPTPKGTLVSIDHATTDKLLLFHVSRRKDGSARLLRIPLWYSILPPLVAILLALILKEVSISLFAGIWTGAFIVGGMRLDSFYYFIMSFLQVVEKYVIHALNDAGHLSVIIFSLLIGGMVAIISRNGGMAGVVTSLSRFAKTARSAQFITWLLGVAIFFDDYANTLIVGNTMRSVTDRFSISREKLAYLVDSTAAPVASIAFITTWIGAELGYIDGGIAQIQDFSFDMTPYAIFIASLKYSFYPLLTLAFILLLIYVGKDFGPMMAAEKRARKTGQVSSAMTVSEDEPDMEDLRPVANAPMAWQHAVYPVLSVIFMTIVGLVSTGMESVQQELSELTSDQYAATWNATWQNMHVLQGSEQIGFFRKLGILIGSADSYVALLWASLIGLVCGIVITLYRKIMNVTHTMHTMVTGFKTMMPALIILTLAWALAHTTEELQTATFLSSALENAINPYLLPMLVFVLAALIAFSTGSSWSTMAILYPIVIPTSWAICQLSGLSEGISLEILLNVISIVMGASVLGDHCSPISDTTILSSLASDCNHIDHVRTQLPYALIVGGISLLCAGLSTYLGGGWLISLLLLAISVAIFLMVITRFGRRALD
ncbi:MAG: Na+/H+ antiporter NhaC family protein [Saprospiraceae bacterium]|nr:Na+/H+ antiporter NhaC family protein [Saprospiraceae bacterium]